MYRGIEFQQGKASKLILSTLLVNLLYLMAHCQFSRRISLITC